MIPSMVRTFTQPTSGIGMDDSSNSHITNRERSEAEHITAWSTALKIHVKVFFRRMVFCFGRCSVVCSRSLRILSERDVFSLA